MRAPSRPGADCKEAPQRNGPETGTGTVRGTRTSGREGSGTPGVGRQAPLHRSAGLGDLLGLILDFFKFSYKQLTQVPVGDICKVPVRGPSSFSFPLQVWAENGRNGEALWAALPTRASRGSCVLKDVRGRTVVVQCVCQTPCAGSLAVDPHPDVLVLRSMTKTPRNPQ